MIYEIQYQHHVQRRHLLYEKESREEHLLSNSLYLLIILTHYTYRYILKSHHINIFKHLSNHSNHYRTSIGLSN